MADHLAVANEILRQLGGVMFKRLVGAKNLTACPDECGALSFRLPNDPGFVSGGINYVKIILTARDDYRLEFGRVRGGKYSLMRTMDEIYCDNVCEAFTSVTGLHTSLGRPR